MVHSDLFHYVYRPHLNNERLVSWYAVQSRRRIRTQGHVVSYAI